VTGDGPGAAAPGPQPTAALTGRERTTELTGPEQTAQAVGAAITEGDRAAHAAGVELVDCGPGWARTTVTIGAGHLNGHDIAHGGIVFLLADVAFAVACNSDGTPTVARSCQIEFVAPAHVGDRLQAHAVERMRQGRGGIYDVAVRRLPGEELIAEMRGNSRELAPGRGRDGAALDSASTKL
jgi:acyl-CoA thioesterase